MAMNDEETVALVAGGHTFGKAHGAADPGRYVGREPEGAGIEEQGSAGKTASAAARACTDHQRHRRRMDAQPDQVGQRLLETLFGYEWELTKSPAGAHQWKPGTPPRRPRCRMPRSDAAPRADDDHGRHGLRMDPAYEKISRRFMQNPQELHDAFARACSS